MDELSASVQFIKGVGPKRVKVLNRLGIYSIRDLLYHFPRKYLDRTRIKTIAEVIAQAEQGNRDEQTVQGRILALSLRRGWRGKTILELALGDQTGLIYALWFNQAYLARNFRKGAQLILSGRVKLSPKPTLLAPEYELINPASGEPPLHAGGIIPCYPLTGQLSQKFMRRVIRTALDRYGGYLKDTISKIALLRPTWTKYNLLSIPEAIQQIHFPSSEEVISRSRRTLAYEELFFLQLALARRYWAMKHQPVRYRLRITKQLEERIRNRIPFTLTAAQERVIGEIKSDLVSAFPMNRLLQGDVGSGKTIVAVYAMLVAIGNHTQVALMAPTEILAQQHYQTLTRLLAGSQVRISLLTRGRKTTDRLAQLELIKQGKVDLIIGTHALIQKKVEFARLSLVIIDEQHKFGVVQRETLRAKGKAPHTLIMTATPIPQTLSLTLFGDLDLSIIDQLPPGRRPVKTILRPTHKMPAAFDFIRAKIREGRQVYFVYPLIEEPKIDTEVVRSATRMAKYLKEQIFPEYNVQLLHGAMKDKKKEAIMQDFRTGKVQILVSTVVIEVGIDVPNACIMVVDHAERYGLSQLHQLRGRIGRGPYDSYCLLFGDFKTPEAEKRLRIMEETQDGFRIAEEDLRIRGPGEFLGTRQSGFPEFRIANLTEDLDLLKQARRDAFRILTAGYLDRWPS